MTVADFTSPIAIHRNIIQSQNIVHQRWSFAHIQKAEKIHHRGECDENLAHRYTFLQRCFVRASKRNVITDVL